ncbi:cyclase family protein [Candidatus Izemoplasma sp. B36]|uniref:cyclase family protein n=1 Tax=Candidatus Izemoplasma sp. B36 TaxID=3242468 RepID=UPI003556AFE3
MNKWIDLTLLVDDSLWTFPGDTPLVKVNEKTVRENGYNLKRIDTNMHIGTHLDMPKHVYDIDEGVETIDINKLIDKAIVIRPKIVDNIIDTKDIIKHYVKDYKIVILDLNWSQYINSEKYYKHPKFDREILQFLLDNKVEVLGMDLPSIAYNNETFLDMHKDVLKENIIIIENLTNLKKLNKFVDFIALPLKIKGLDGSLIRCVAKN